MGPMRSFRSLSPSPFFDQVEMEGEVSRKQARPWAALIVIGCLHSAEFISLLDFPIPAFSHRLFEGGVRQEVALGRFESEIFTAIGVKMSSCTARTPSGIPRKGGRRKDAGRRRKGHTIHVEDGFHGLAHFLPNKFCGRPCTTRGLAAEASLRKDRERARTCLCGRYLGNMMQVRVIVRKASP